jgi:hypothetical protein
MKLPPQSSQLLETISSPDQIMLEDTSIRNTEELEQLMPNILHETRDSMKAVRFMKNLNLADEEIPLPEEDAPLEEGEIKFTLKTKSVK